MNETTFRKFWNIIDWVLLIVVTVCLPFMLFSPHHQMWGQVAMVLLVFQDAVNHYLDYKNHRKKSDLCYAVAFSVLLVMLLSVLIPQHL